MSFLRHLITSKGVTTAARRFLAIARQVGPTRGRMARTLDAYLDLTAAFDVRPTFPTPAAVVYRHPRLMKHLVTRGAEVAVHGNHHVDFTHLSPQEQEAHLQEAARRFRARGIPFVGFRAPYLRWDDALVDALDRQGFAYDSSLSIWWDVLDEPLSPQAEARLGRVLEFYDPLLADATPSLPTWEGNLVRLPVSLPDDEILVDRVGMRDSIRIGDVWRAILRQTYERDELFVLQLHPERFTTCAQGLRLVLEDARNRKPPVWIAPLEEVARWWRHKQHLDVRVLPAGPQTWQIQIPENDQVALLVRNVRCDAACQPWDEHWQHLPGPRVTVHSPSRPTIGITPQVPDALVRFLRDLGYIVEPATPEHVYVVDETEWSPAISQRLLRRLSDSRVPLVRLNRWPGTYRSALCITGDLDAVTWWDFAYRLISA